MEYQLIAVEYRILKIICELDSVKVAGIRTELAEHAVTKVVQIIVQQLQAFVQSWQNMQSPRSY